MHSVPQSVTSDPENEARFSRSVSSMSIRDLDYATWYAHIAGTASQHTLTQITPEQRGRLVHELSASDAAQSGRQAA
jgi:hypothetical protein